MVVRVVVVVVELCECIISAAAALLLNIVVRLIKMES